MITSSLQKSPTVSRLDQGGRILFSKKANEYSRVKRRKIRGHVGEALAQDKLMLLDLRGNILPLKPNPWPASTTNTFAIDHILQKD